MNHVLLNDKNVDCRIQNRWPEPCRFPDSRPPEMTTRDSYSFFMIVALGLYGNKCREFHAFVPAGRLMR